MRTQGSCIGIGATVLALVTASCGPSPRPEVVDAAPLPPDATREPYWLVMMVSHPTGGATTQIVPYDGRGFQPPCFDHKSIFGSKDLVEHPSLPYLYGVGRRLEGMVVTCAAVTAPPALPLIGAGRPLQRIVLDPTGTVGFFTIDGPATLGVYRFSVGADGVPAVGEAAIAPTISGALALDPAGELFVGGKNAIAAYPLTGPELVLPTMGVTAATCAQPVDLVTTGTVVLAFCSDTADVWRYARAPFALDTTVAATSPVDRVVLLPGDRAIAARTDPPGLSLLHLDGGALSWIDGPALATRITAMAAARNGSFVATARELDDATSELALWNVRLDTIRLVGTQTFDGRATSLALVPATP